MIFNKKSFPHAFPAYLKLIKSEWPDRNLQLNPVDLIELAELIVHRATMYRYRLSMTEFYRQFELDNDAAIYDFLEPLLPDAVMLNDILYFKNQEDLERIQLILEKSEDVVFNALELASK